MSDREALLQQVRMYDFALIDATLFLDGHPKDAAALAYHNKVKDLYEQAVQKYESSFGPLSMKHAGGMAKWNWVDDPWPWEGADNKNDNLIRVIIFSYICGYKHTDFDVFIPIFEPVILNCFLGLYRCLPLKNRVYPAKVLHLLLHQRQRFSGLPH